MTALSERVLYGISRKVKAKKAKEMNVAATVCRTLPRPTRPINPARISLRSSSTISQYLLGHHKHLSEEGLDESHATADCSPVLFIVIVEHKVKLLQRIRVIIHDRSTDHVHCVKEEAWHADGPQ